MRLVCSFAISLFVRANVNRLNYIKEEATKFILSVANGYDVNSLVISFSGGKDSTATADIVAKAFGGEIGPSILHYFGAIASRYETEIKKLQTEIDDFWVYYSL